MELQSSPHLQDASVPRPGRGRLILSKSSRDGSTIRPEQSAGQAFRVLIVDRDSMSSDLLAAALMQDKTCHASSVPSSELLRRLATNQTDLVVIGAQLDHSSITGFDLAHQVRTTYPAVLIVMLVNQSTRASVIEAFRSGARGVFSRQHPVADFLGCIQHVRKGFLWAAAQETKFLLEAFRCMPSANPALTGDSLSLTVRELQIVRCAARGKTNKVIAAELGLSEHTIKNYLFRAFEKLGVSNRVELLLYLTVRGYASEPARVTDPEADLCDERTSA